MYRCIITGGCVAACRQSFLFALTPHHTSILCLCNPVCNTPLPHHHHHTPTLHPHSTILSLEFDEGGRHQEGEPLICWDRRLQRQFVLLKKEKERKRFILLLNWWQQTGLRAFSGKLLSETGWSCFVLTFCRKIRVFFIIYFWVAANLLLETLLPQHGFTVKIKVEQKWIIQHIYS